MNQTPLKSPSPAYSNHLPKAPAAQPPAVATAAPEAQPHGVAAVDPGPLQAPGPFAAHSTLGGQFALPPGEDTATGPGPRLATAASHAKSAEAKPAAKAAAAPSTAAVGWKKFTSFLRAAGSGLLKLFNGAMGALQMIPGLGSIAGGLKGLVGGLVAAAGGVLQWATALTGASHGASSQSVLASLGSGAVKVLKGLAQSVVGAAKTAAGLLPFV